MVFEKETENTVLKALGEGKFETVMLAITSDEKLTHADRLQLMILVHMTMMLENMQTTLESIDTGLMTKT